MRKEAVNVAFWEQRRSDDAWILGGTEEGFSHEFKQSQHIARDTHQTKGSHTWNKRGNKKTEESIKVSRTRSAGVSVNKYARWDQKNKIRDGKIANI